MSEQAVTDYKQTLNLPQTEFKMKAGAPTREPELEALWEEGQVYQKVMASKDKTHRFLLHDGPPYLSSEKIHIGTALNKILKDIVTKYKSQCGYYSPYVPGYDGHGLPIENAVVKSIKGGRQAVSAVELRKLCREFAMKNLKGQETNFKRLGVWGNWENPYVTIDGKFEATQIRVFWDMYQQGYVYKGMKPVYWCAHCETALADAEVEYADHLSPSIYVRFQAGVLKPAGLPEHISWADTYFVIWTTTPWTLPANLGLALNAELDYVFIKTAEWGTLIVAEALLEAFLAETGITDADVLYKTKGGALENLKPKHPFYDRLSPTVLGTHVTAEAGTGIVHTAPGHGHDDYLVGQKYNLGILSPLNSKGIFTAEAGAPFEGQFYEKANPLAIETLAEHHALIKASKFNHSYPHCWRCHNPVIYRATEQWFISIEGFRQKALDEIRKVSWIPARGETRIASMIEGRTDWCISRQRVWGVPIPVLYCSGCNEVLINEQIIDKIVSCFEKETSDAWWAYEADYFLPAGIACACGGREFTKEMDIMDVWFDSGITHTAVVEARSEELGHLPVELYLEGSDQHRGWFQSALLTSVAIRGHAPYKSVLTHGFVLDQDGRKMSKSLGNVVDPLDVINQLGADVLRLWVASVDYTNDVRIGKELLNQLAEVYRKVRNTIRFILGNLNSFDQQADSLPYNKLSKLDQYMLHRTQEIVQILSDAFESYEFHRYYQVLQNFCVTDLSALYFDVIKDILYTAPKNSPERAAVQTVLYQLLSTLTPMLVPVMPHMAEDIWLSIPEAHKPQYGNPAVSPASILMAPWPKVKNEYLNLALEVDFKELLRIKDAVNIALEIPRAGGLIGSSLEAAILIETHSEESAELLSNISMQELATLFVVSQVSLVEQAPAENIGHAEGPLGSAITIYALKASGKKCVRCWKYLDSVGQNAEHTEICSTCVSAVLSK